MSKEEIQKLKDDVEDLKKADCDFKEAIKGIGIKLQPIYDNYIATKTIGKWSMAILTFIAILIGIIISCGKIFK